MYIPVSIKYVFRHKYKSEHFLKCSDINKKEFTKIQKLAKQIREDSDALLVIGIGGSYLGAKSGLELLAKNSKVEIVFAGINFDYSDLYEKLEYLKNKNVTVNVVPFQLCVADTPSLPFEPVAPVSPLSPLSPFSP